MKTYISILRGINVGGQKPVQMTTLKKIFEELGFQNVQTYIQSGNVVFQALDEDYQELKILILKELSISFGFEIPVILLTLEELRTIAENNPFRDNLTKEEIFMHVTFLNAVPEHIDMTAIKEKKADREEITIYGKAIYLYCPYGYGQTKLSNNFFEKILKTGATTRNWKTTMELLKMAENV
jgi:uncharacterized protein (DUF1697 family)